MFAKPKLDRIDVNILAQLQHNGRLSNVELANNVGLSPSPCLTRVRRLEEAGMIVSYNARLQLNKLLEHITVFTEVTLSDQRREDFIRFEAEIRKFELIQEVHMVSGGYDYLLKFVVKNVATYHELMERILDRNIGIAKYFSYIVIKTIYDRGATPLKALLPDE
jgi:DNA-binding Lrp family transcriptional regulator